MNNVRTKLLLEAMEETAPPAVGSHTRTFEGGRTTVVELEEGNPFGRPRGRYITVETTRVQKLGGAPFEAAVEEIARHLAGMIRGERVLVAALGTSESTPDALGPKMMRHLLVTRPFEKIAPELLGRGKMRTLSALCTNVYGVTGIESAELLRGAIREVRPDTVIVVDALATSSKDRLCATVQLSESGMIPGSGVGNDRPDVTAETLGVPVISVGMPTVMNDDRFSGDEGLVVIPYDIAAAVDGGAKLLGLSVSRAAHFEMPIPDILGYLS